MVISNYNVFIIHCIATFIMVGVIWVIQLVHYPSFYYIDKKKYQSFQKFHMNNISYIVMPTMLVELCTGFILILYFNNLYGNFTFYLSIFLLFCIWLITGIIFTKLHNKLLEGYDELIIKKMIEWNWSRTLFWTFRFVLLSYSFYLA